LRLIVEPLAGRRTMPGCVLRIRSKTARVEDLVKASGFIRL